MSSFTAASLPLPSVRLLERLRGAESPGIALTPNESIWDTCRSSSIDFHCSRPLGLRVSVAMELESEEAVASDEKEGRSSRGSNDSRHFAPNGAQDMERLAAVL